MATRPDPDDAAYRGAAPDRDHAGRRAPSGRGIRVSIASQPSDTDRLDHPSEPPSSDADQPARAGGRARVRTAAAWLATVLAALLVWFALVGPDQLDRLGPGAFLRIPIEGLVIVALSLILPPRARRILAVIAGVLLGLLTVVKILDMGFFAALDRPFQPGDRLELFRAGRRRAPRFSRSDVGRRRSDLGGPPRRGRTRLRHPVARTPDPADRPPSRSVGPHHRRARTRLDRCAPYSACKSPPAAPVASTSAAGLAYDQVREVRAGIRDQQEFAGTLASPDSFREHAGRGPAHRPAGQGRHRGVRRELRAHRRPRLGVLTAGRCRPQCRHELTARRRILLPERVPDVTDLRRHQLAGPLHLAVGAVDRQSAALQPARREQPLHAERRLQAGGLADGRRHPLE